MKITIKFNPQYPKKAASNIMVSISYEGQRIQLSTGISLPTKSWDLKKAKVKPAYKHSFELNRYLEKIESDIKDFYLKKKSLNEEVTKIQIKEVFYSASSVEFNTDESTKIQEKLPTLFEAFDKFIMDKEKSGRYSKAAVQKDRACFRHLKTFAKRKQRNIEWEDLEKTFAEEFLLFLVEKQKLTNSTAKKTLSTFKAFLNVCTDKGINTNLIYVKSFVDARKILKDSTNDHIIALTENEFRLLLDYEPLTPKLKKVKSLFLLQIYLGVRVSDLLNIKPANIDFDNNLMHIHQIKTNEYLTIPIHNLIKEILEQFPDRTIPKISSQRYNDYIKELCRNAGIDQPILLHKLYGKKKIEEVKPKWQLISSHTARRTFITLSLKRGILPEYVMKVSGHKSRRSFEKYIRITQNEAHEAVTNAWEN